MPNLNIIKLRNGENADIEATTSIKILETILTELETDIRRIKHQLTNPKPARTPDWEQRANTALAVKIQQVEIIQQKINYLDLEFYRSFYLAAESTLKTALFNTIYNKARSHAPTPKPTNNASQTTRNYLRPS